MADAPRPELVLASASPSRRRMLEAAGLSFRVVAAEMDEVAMRGQATAGDAPRTAEMLAKAKAAEVSKRLPGTLVIGADQVLTLGDRLLSKPKDLGDARGQLMELRGRTHSLHTAVALAREGAAVWSHTDTAHLAMRSFSDAFLERYLDEVGARVCQTVGAYEIEGRGIQLFESVAGDHFTIIGLPLLPLLAELRARGATDA